MLELKLFHNFDMEKLVSFGTFMYYFRTVNFYS